VQQAMRAVFFAFALVLVTAHQCCATRIEVRAAASAERRSHTSMEAHLQADQQVRLNEVDAFRLSFYFAPGYCAGVAAAGGKCHGNVKTGGGNPKREFFLHGLWESPSQNNGFADAVNAADAGGGNRPSWDDLDGKPGLQLKDWYTITNSGVDPSQASHALPAVAAVTMALMQERKDAKFIAVPRGAAGLDATIMGARGGFVQTNNGVLPFSASLHGVLLAC